MTDNRTTERVSHSPRVREAIDELMRENDALKERVAELEADLVKARNTLEVVDWWTDEHGDTHAIAANGEEVCHYVRGDFSAHLNKMLAERDALVRDLLQLRCRQSCADCEHEDDEGCDFMTRALELGIEVY